MKDLQPGRIARRRAGDIDGQRDVGMGVKLRHRHFQRAAVDQMDEAELLGGGDELARGRDRAVLAPHAQQAFVMHGRARLGVDDRLDRRTRGGRPSAPRRPRRRSPSGAGARFRAAAISNRARSRRGRRCARVPASPRRAASLPGWSTAPCGSHTAPTELVAETMPARVSITRSRTAARSRSATSVDLAFAAIAEDDAELVAGGAADHVGASAACATAARPRRRSLRRRRRSRRCR